MVERPTVDQQAQSRVLTPPPHTMLIMADLGGAGWDGDERLLCQVKVWKVKGWLSSEHVPSIGPPLLFVGVPWGCGQSLS